MSFTDAEIGHLTSCKKTVTEPPRKEMKVERGHRRNDMRLKAAGEELDFRVFIRQNLDFEENFSVGLEFLPRDGRRSLVLLRCNGPHGRFEGGVGDPVAHFTFHVHRAKADNLDRDERAERGGEHTSAFASLQEALAFFVQEINLEGAEEYFPSTLQKKLPFTGKES